MELKIFNNKMNNKILKNNEEKTIIKKSKSNLLYKSSFKKKINESLQKKTYHFKVLASFQNIVLINYIFINLFTNVISKNKIEDNNNNRKLSLANEIKIKIMGKGNQYVMNSEFSSKCNEIIINGNRGVLGENRL